MIIGLNGAKGSGKDTVGAFLVDKYGFYRLSFAQALKESAASLFGVTPEFWDEAKNDDWYNITLWRGPYPAKSETIKTVTARKFLQLYGTEAHRDIFGKDFWVDALIPLNVAGHHVNNYVITDARFPNELERIRDLGGITVRLERPEIEDGDSHVSESVPPAGLIDHVIANVGTIDDLYAMTDSLMEELEIRTFQHQ